MVKLSDLFRYYKHGTPHQMAAISELETELLKLAPELFNKDQPWYKTWQQGGKLHNYDSAAKLIKEFEGCHLSAYPDPLSGGDPWTIGYGTTRYSDGRKVQRGDKITVIEAGKLLDVEIERIVEKLRATVPFWNAMSGDKQSALISFAYNLGSGFYGSTGFETISKRLKEKDWAAVPEAMLLYRNPGTSVEAGLLRRRQAEGRLWGLPEMQQQPAKLSLNSPFTARITPHITLGEFALGQEARRFDHQHQVDTAAELATFLERVRIAFGGKPIIITSGYRPPAVNRAVGGASGSEHLYDAPSVGAVDFYIDGADIYKVQEWCDRNWAYSLGYGAPKGFVHLGIRKGRPRVRWDY
jgi:GH24 family phage-related lysozyme (muramidase)